VYKALFLCHNSSKKGGANKMEKMFNEIYKNEKNEHTAFVLMLGVLSEKLTEIINLITKANTLSTEIHAILKEEKNKPKAEIVIFEPMTPEDYME
jgi:2-hydroxy-3-keto-5-methylthiopentenyl-1-phosphate phosphatase